MPDLAGYLEMQTPFAEVAVRLFLAMLFGAVIGWEREVHDKPAGLRTHMLVSLGAASFMLLASELTLEAFSRDQVRLDPTRVVEGVVTGIGFLGAGTIIQAGGDVRGLTTAAAIWVVGSVGLACGGGYYLLAGLVVVGSIFILVVCRLIERFR